MITAKKLLTTFSVVPPSFLEDAPNEAYHPLLGILTERYSRTGAIADLEEAIQVSQQAIDATPDDHPDQGIYQLPVKLTDELGPYVYILKIHISSDRWLEMRFDREATIY